MNDRGRLLQAQGEALADKILLEELRAGRVTNAIELLEQQLDVQVLKIDRLRRTASQAEAEGALSTLGAVEHYRSLYPRKSEASIEGIEHLDPDFNRAQERVAAILHDAKTARVQLDGPTNGSRSVRPGTNEIR